MKEINYIDGPYLNLQTGRYVVVIQYKDGTRKLTNRARYNLSIKLGRELTKDEEADHIDDNKLNDNPDNLQILTHKENNQKYCEQLLSYPNFKFTCPICKVEVIREFGYVKSHWKEGKGGPFCDHSCSNKFQYHINLPQTQEEREFLAKKFKFNLQKQTYITDGGDNQLSSEIQADLKRMRDDIATLNDIVYGAHRSARANEDMEFPIRSIQMKLTVINDIFKRIEENWKKEKI